MYIYIYTYIHISRNNYIFMTLFMATVDGKETSAAGFLSGLGAPFVFAAALATRMVKSWQSHSND